MDGNVTVLDASDMLKKMAEWDIDLFNESAADMDGDGVFTVNDIKELLIYLASY